MKKIIKYVVFSVALISLYNIYMSVSLKQDALNVALTSVEALADDENGSDHGRPLLQSTSGAYKCGNCDGNDCGAVC